MLSDIMRDDLRDIRNSEFVSQTGRTLLTLRELLLKGEYSCGERLSELALVERLGVSRTPIRLALDRLAHEGLLEPSPSGGFVVREFTIADIWDAIEMRGVMEGTAARLAAERLTDRADLRRIQGFQVQMDQVIHNTIESFAVYMNLNEAFHYELVELARSPMLKRSIGHLTTLPFAAPSAMVFARSRLPRAAAMVIVGQEQHHAILEALERRQGARAEALAREHALLARRNLESVLSDESILACVPGASLILRAPAVN
jgi:GntR family transcriptional regulator, vanillate catabolism transcriptional regulator